MKTNKRALLALLLASTMTMTGCASYMDEFMQGSSTSSSVTSSSSEPTTSEPDFITGSITTSDILDDIKIMSRLVTPSDFSVTMIDSDSKYGSVSVTVDMHLAEGLSEASFKDFKITCDDYEVTIPDFDLYMSGDSYYISEDAMTVSTTLSARIAMLLSSASGELKDDEKAEQADIFKKMSEATQKVMTEAGSDQYVKLGAVDAASVPAVLMTPVSATMVSGFFGKDMSYVADLFADKKDMFCKTDADGKHIFEVNKDNGAAFFDALLSLDDNKILMLVMIDSYDDMLWTSITDETWETLQGAVQARIDAYKAHWTECKTAITEGKLDYFYKLTMDFDSDVDFSIRLEMNTQVDDSSVNRVFEIVTLEKPESLELPDGLKILSSEQWEAEIQPLVDKYLAEFKTETE